MKSVLAAIRRWEGKALVEGALADRLRAEVAESSASGNQLLFQYVLAATGAVLLVIASGVFLGWAWPQMTESLQTVFLAVVGLAIHLAGVRLERQRRWLPAAYLMQTSGVILLAIAFVHSERAWPAGSVGGTVVGIVALGLPFVLGLRTLRRNSIMPAVHFAVGLLFVAVFLDRVTPLQDQGVVWAMDAVLFASILGMLVLLRRDPSLERHRWALNALAMALYAGFVMVIYSANALDLGEDSIYPLDVWLFLTAAVTIYGIHWAPEGLRRAWFGSQLALCQFVWIPLGLVSTVGMGGQPESALVAVGGSGVAGLLYTRMHRVRDVLAVSALSIVVSAWFWGVQRAGALGAAFGLAATAALLFWLSGKGSGEPTVT